MNDELRYPIGKFNKPLNITQETVDLWIDEIESFPERLEHAVKGMSEIELATPYRPDGWTIAQVVHHCADSNLNSYIRFKWAITEENPTIKPYYEERWAELEDGKSLDIKHSLALLKALHVRWTILLRSLTKSDYKRTFVHPDNNKTYRLDENIGIYAWHGNHHIAHVRLVKP